MINNFTKSYIIGADMKKKIDKIENEKDKQLDENNPMFVRFISDDRTPIVEDGDHNTAFLPRYVLSPFRGLSSGLTKKEDLYVKES
jgi:hypothetical protein